ncbi:ADP-heptose:LPS heptosyltransferase [Nonlabens sp. Hel1_33_55]|uniref:glycosyltransferase family 9 protein n=1 Tax=Nonlabens sp. Hel1_33_55 TaxID=1336802 RepID=UPI000875B0D4|nr:glycosyltransferase family 9 protein [Nonlabens sp. Hel1_33_55]SCY32811.1 ADP-heptose:LPS heptosyltransferase [Nonlabens sp. Hel1_33_55]
MKPQRLLTIRLSAMGDVAMTVPVLLALRRLYPEVEVISLSRKRFFSIIQQVPDIELVEADVNGAHKGVLGLTRLAKELSKHQPDAVADFHNVLRTKILRALIRKPIKAVIDKGRADKKKLVSDPEFFQPLKSIIGRYQDVLDKLQLPVELNPTDVLPQLSIPEKVHSLVGDHNYKWIGIAPFAAHKSKSLSLNKAKELVSKLLEIGNIKLVLFGGGATECKKLEIVAGTHSNVFNLAGFMSFEEELAMISNLDAMIAVDTGNGHLAAMYGVPVITLWGNTHPYAGFTPFSQPNENQITVDREQFPLIPTSIYGNKVPAGYEDVLDTIDCALVVARLKEILS